MKTFCARILVPFVFLGIALSAQTGSINTNHTLYIGVLDDAREEMLDWKSGFATQGIIRPAFEKTATGWKQVDSSSLPTHMNWTVAFDGRDLGQVESQVSSEEGLTAVQKILTSASAIPAVGSPSQQFAGLMAVGPTKTRGPW